MRHTMLSVGALLALVAIAGPSQGQDDSDRVIRGKRASEWATILRKDKDVQNRRRAVIALGLAGPQTRKVFEDVGTALREDSEEIVRRTAANVLGSLGASAIDPERIEKIPVKAGVDALAFALKQDKSAEVRAAAATALGRLRKAAREAVPVLAEALKHPDLGVRSSAAEALTTVGEHAAGAVSELAEALRQSKGQETVRLRSYIVSALARAGKAAGPAVSALIEVLKEPELTTASPEARAEQAELRRTTMVALGSIGDPAAVPALAAVLEDSMIVTVIKLKDDRGGERVIRRIKNIGLARAAIEALNRFGSERKNVLPTLVKAMAGEQDKFVRCQAITAVGQLGKELGDHRKSVVASLRRGLTDKINDVRLAAILAIGELGPQPLGDELKPIRQELQLATRAPQKDISDAAAGALKQLGK